MCAFLLQVAFKQGRAVLAQHIVQFCEDHNIPAYRAMAANGVMPDEGTWSLY